MSTAQVAPVARMSVSRASRPRIFISYRRADSAAIVGHIYERMVARYRKEAVFRDIDDVPLGGNFYDHVRKELSRCDIVIIVLGPRWAGVGSDGASRIQQKDDPVRIEVEAALDSGATVIPILVEGASVPKRADLPDSLTDLPSLNAARVDTGKDFDHHVAELIRSMDAILQGRGKFVVEFPAWAQKAAIWCGAAALTSLAAFLGVAFTGPALSPGLALLSIAAISLGLACACAFACGDAVGKRRIPFLFCQKHSAAFSVGAGVFAFVVLFASGAFLNPLLPGQAMVDPLHLAKRLRGEFIRARDNLEKTGSADFRQAEHLVDVLKDLDPQSGHAWYFAGEIKRVRNSAQFTLKSCFKGWPNGEAGNLEAYQHDFYRYREIAVTLPALETGGDPSSEVCYSRAKGFCTQRMAWIYHLLANDFHLHALVLNGRDRVGALKHARELAEEARKYRRPEGGEGFNQCSDTSTLAEKIGEELDASRATVLVGQQRLH